MDVPELRRWIEDAMSRHSRDVAERGEPDGFQSTDEIVDAVWGRLPLAVRREVSRAQVQASLTMLSLRHRFGGVPDPAPDPLPLAPGTGSAAGPEVGRRRAPEVDGP